MSDLHDPHPSEPPPTPEAQPPLVIPVRYAAPPPPAATRPTGGSALRAFLVIVLALSLGLAGAALAWWINERHYESTDDAQIEGHVDAISARITGTVLCIGPHIENNQFVKAGTLLIELDPNDYQATAIRL